MYKVYKSLIILILWLITTHINFPPCVSPTPWLTPNIREEKNFLCNQGKRGMYSEDSGFPCSSPDSFLSTLDYSSKQSINGGIPETLNISETIAFFFWNMENLAGACWIGSTIFHQYSRARGGGYISRRGLRGECASNEGVHNTRQSRRDNSSKRVRDRPSKNITLKGMGQLGGRNVCRNCGKSLMLLDMLGPFACKGYPFIE